MWNIPNGCKKIYSRGLDGKHIDTTNSEKHVALLRKILSTLNEDTYEEYFHNLLWFEESEERICLQKQTVQCVRIQKIKDRYYKIIVPGLERKQRYVRINNFLLLISRLDSIKYYAKIKEICVKRNMLEVALTNDSSINVDEKFQLIFLFSNYQHDMMHKAVNGILANKHVTKIFPKKNVSCNEIKSIKEWFNPQIAKNKEQRMAVEHIVARTSVPAPYILHGPPGTGKTATIVEAILQVLKTDSSSVILVCAPSNSAADDVASKLVKYESLFPNTRFSRCNSEYRDWSTFPKCLKKHSYVSEGNLSIIVSTISYAGEAIKHVRCITHLFIDEAAQATEPLCLVPIREVLLPGGLLVLSGDPLQLGPVIVSEFAKKYGLGTSLMERLMKNTMYNGHSKDPNYTVMLKKNFRSHADILQIPNKYFYKGQLEVCAKEDVISREDILFKREHSHAIVFCAVLGQEEREGQSSSYFNEEELLMLKISVKKLIAGKHKEKAENIGIITPYTAQVDKIKEWLCIEKQSAIEVGSVESYQGREKKIILMSTVRGQGTDTTKKVKLGFLKDLKRFNVAITRAKAKLIVIGNPNCLIKDKLWRIYIETCKDMGTYHKIVFKQKPKSDNQLKLTTRLRKMQIA